MTTVIEDLMKNKKGSNLSDEVRSNYEQLKLENLMREINRKDDVDLQKFREYKDFSSMNFVIKSEILHYEDIDKISMNNIMYSNRDEIIIDKIGLDNIKEIKADSESLDGFEGVGSKGYRIKTGEKLYSKDKPKMVKEKLTFIPYYTFANRGESNMQVWVNYVK